MPWDLFLMKKLLKSGICESVNSARMHCSLWKSQQVRAEPKKKRKEKSAGQKRKRNNQLNPNTHKERYRVLCLVAKMKHFFLS